MRVFKKKSSNKITTYLKSCLSANFSKHLNLITQVSVSLIIDMFCSGAIWPCFCWHYYLLILFKLKLNWKLLTILFLDCFVPSGRNFKWSCTKSYRFFNCSHTWCQWQTIQKGKFLKPADTSQLSTLSPSLQLSFIQLLSAVWLFLTQML